MCAVCVTDHAEHDFVVADYKAANLIKQKLTGWLGSLDSLIEEYTKLLNTTSSKVEGIKADQKSEE